MYDNNLDAILSSFYLLNKKNEKINYYYEPMFTKKNKDWKRSYVIKELENDFKKDVMNYGFNPFSENNYNEQKKDKNITKYFYVEHYNFSDYIKKMNFLIHHKQKINNNNTTNSKDKVNNSFQNKEIKAKKSFPSIFPKTTHNLSVSNLFKEKNNRIKNLKTLSKIVKFNRENMDEQARINRKKLNINDEIDSSFNYEDENNNKHNDENNFLENENRYLNKKIHKGKGKLNKTNNIINNDNKIKSFNQNKKYQVFNKTIKIMKIKIEKNNNKSFLKNRNASVKNLNKMVELYNPFYRNKKIFSRGKFKEENKKQHLYEKQYRNKNLYLEKLENYSKSIFKTAKKIK